MPEKKNTEIDALMELERRSMAGDASITPDIASKVKSKLDAYRKQGLVEPIGGVVAPSLSKEEMDGVRNDALQKVKLARSLRRRSKNDWFATGFGASTASDIPGTSAYDVKSDTKSLAAGGGLQRVMELAKTNGGKNPLTPLSNTDFQALSDSVANLDMAQSDEQYQRNVQIIEDIYARAYKAAGGGDLERDIAGADNGGKSNPNDLGAGESGSLQFNDQIPDPVGWRMTPEQQAGFSQFVTANQKIMTPGLLQEWAKAHGLPPIQNIDEYVKGVQSTDAPPTVPDYTNQDEAAKEAARKRLSENNAGGVGGALVMGAGDTASLGFLDEAMGGVKSLYNGKSWDQNTQDIRAEQAVQQEDHFPSYTLGQLAGGAAIPVGSKAKTVAEMTKVGGGLGTAYGVGSGTDTGSRFRGGVMGGVAGAATGAGFAKLGDIWRGRGGPTPPGGGPAQEAADVFNASKDLGVDILPADAGGPVTRTLSSAFRATPGGAQPITAAARKSIGQASDALDTIAAREGSALPDREAAGNVIRQGALDYRDSSRSAIGRGYDRAAELAGGARVEPKAAVAAIDRHIADLKEIPGGGDGLSVLEGLKSEIEKMGSVTVNGIRGMRTQLRQKFMKDGLRGSDVERRVNDVIDAASQDLQTSLNTQGKGEAARAYAKADSEWGQRIKNLDEVIMPIIGKKGEKSGEQIVAGLNSAARGNNARLGRLFEVLPEDVAGDARATLIQQMGRAGDGAQNAKGDAFSFDTFLTNWNKIGDSAKNTIFRGDNRKAIDQLALLAERSKAAGKYQNYSNTGLAVVTSAMFGGGAAGGPAGLAIAGKALLGQYAIGHLLASPTVAKALLNIAKAKTPEAINARINMLSSLGVKDPTVRDGVQALQSKLLSAMNDNAPASAAASQDKQNKGQ